MPNFNWSGTDGGDWTTRTDWKPTGVPGSGDNVFINTAGTYAVTITTEVSAAAVTLNDVGAALSDSGALTLAGGVKELSVKSGTFQLNSGGSVVGGTVVAGPKGVFAWDGGTLDGVTFDGALSLAGGTVQIESGITFNGASGTGAGTIAVNGGAATLSLIGATTLDNATLNIGASMAGKVATVSGSAITFGAKLKFDQTGLQARVSASASVDNLGSMTLDLKGGHFGLTSTKAFINSGTVSVSNGEVVQLHDAGVTNQASGTISITGAGSSVVLDSADAFSNHGAVTVGTAAVPSDGELVIDANVMNTNQFIAEGDGSLTINGALTGAGSVLISTGGSVTLNGAVQSTQNVFFLDATGTLKLHLPSANSFAGGIAGFSFINKAIYDKIDLIDAPATTVTSTATTESAELTVSNGANVVATLDLIGNYVGQKFQVASDLHGGSVITLVQDTSSVAGAHRFAQAAAAFAAPTGGADLQPHSAPIGFGMALSVSRALSSGRS